MNNPSQSSPSRRLFRVIAVAIALPLIALVPAFLASSMITQDATEPDDHIEQSVTIDVTDIDPEGTVMYTVIPPIDHPGSPDAYTIKRDAMQRALLEDPTSLHITIEDDEDPARWLGPDSEDICTFTLHLSSDDPYDDQSDTFTGYIRVTDDQTMAHDDLSQQEDCGLYITYTH